MLEVSDLKTWLFKDLSRLEKLLLILAACEDPQSVSGIRDVAVSVGFREPKNRNWNISQILGASKGQAVRSDAGWELTEGGKIQLRSIGVMEFSEAATQTALDLRKHLSKLKDEGTRRFVEEAIRCHENRLYRSAIVMSWLGAVDVLHKHVHSQCLAEFNAEAKRVNGKWKPAKTADDLGRMGESEFLDRISAISVIGKNTKDELQKALGLRNGCGHPNSLQVSTNKSAAHLETLLQNVFERFQ